MPKEETEHLRPEAALKSPPAHVGGTAGVKDQQTPSPGLRHAVLRVLRYMYM